MKNSHTMKEFKMLSHSFKHVVPWENVKMHEIYHIPPLFALERRDIIILQKDGDNATYRRVDVKDDTERIMHKTSVFAKFIVKRKKY